MYSYHTLMKSFKDIEGCRINFYREVKGTNNVNSYKVKEGHMVDFYYDGLETVQVDTLRVRFKDGSYKIQLNSQDIKATLYWSDGDKMGALHRNGDIEPFEVPSVLPMEEYNLIDVILPFLKKLAENMTLDEQLKFLVKWVGMPAEYWDSDMADDGTLYAVFEDSESQSYEVWRGENLVETYGDHSDALAIEFED